MAKKSKVKTLKAEVKTRKAKMAKQEKKLKIGQEGAQESLIGRPGRASGPAFSRLRTVSASP